MREKEKERGRPYHFAFIVLFSLKKSERLKRQSQEPHQKLQFTILLRKKKSKVNKQTYIQCHYILVTYPRKFILLIDLQ